MMQMLPIRFSDQPLPERPHIAVLFSDKIGGFIAATPLLRGLKAKYREAILDYFGGEVTRELEAGCPWIDSRFSLHPGGGGTSLGVYISLRVGAQGPYDLAINLDRSAANMHAVMATGARLICGPAIDPNTGQELPFLLNERDQLWGEPDWNSTAFRTRYGDLSGSGYIGEIFCSLAYVMTDGVPGPVPTQPPPAPVPDVLIAVSATRAAKRWTTAGWLAVLDWCRSRGLSVGLLGSKPEVESQLYGAGEQEATILATRDVVDLRGALTLGEVAGALQAARACVTIDAGLMHLSAAVGAPTIAVFGNMASPRRLWAPPGRNVRVVSAEPACTLCEAARFRNRACLREDGQQVCMTRVDPSMVILELERSLVRHPDSVPS